MSDTQQQPRRRKHTVESLTKIAAEYETRVEFSRANPSAYKAARRLGNAAYNQICSHMKEGGYKSEMDLSCCTTRGSKIPHYSPIPFEIECRLQHDV